MSSAYQEAALESTFQKIARIIARRYGITVSIRGSSAFVDLQTCSIVLPSMAQDQNLELDCMDGFLDHECAHILFTSVDVEKEAKKFGAALYGFWNGCEDVWIEREMGAKFLGCHQNMERLNAWLYRTYEDRWTEVDPLGRLYYALERCYRGEHEKERYVSDPFIGGIIMLLQEEIERARVCSSSHEAWAIAQSIYEKIKDLAVGQRKGHGDDGRSDGSDDLDGSFGDAGGGDSQSSSTFQGGDKDHQELREEGGDNSEKEGEEGLIEGQRQARSFLRLESSGNLAKPLDVESLVNESLEGFFDLETDNGPDHYVVFSEEFDYDTTYDEEYRVSVTDDYRRIKAEVEKYVGNLANVLELILTTEAEDRWVGGSRKGKKFDQRRLAYWAEGADDDRIFRYMEEGIRHDTAISMLWDCSGSMSSSSVSGTKAELARIAAVACHEALIKCKSIAHEVLGFNTGGGTNPKLSALVANAKTSRVDLSRYSRLEELDARMVFVPFGSSDGRALVAINGSHANRDGECVLWAARRLARRSEKRKILLVGSDGHPQGARYHKTERSYLREVVRRVMATGIEVYGLGIMDNAVASYYPNYEVIHAVNDLPKAVMALLVRSLPAQRGSYEGIARI